MPRLHSLLVALIAVSGLSAGACMPPAAVRVGVVDGARVIQITKRGKKIRDQLQTETNRLSVMLQAGQRKLKALALEAEVLEQKTPRDDKAVAAKRRELKEAEVALQGLHVKLQEQLNKQGEKLLDEFKEKIRQLALRIKDRSGLDLVIMTSRGDSLWVWPATDITDKVVQEMDAQE